MRAFEVAALPEELAPITHRLLKTASIKGQKAALEEVPVGLLPRDDDAPVRAAKRADELREQADLNGTNYSRLIVHRFNQLLESQIGQRHNQS